jgi:hypothetical protein
LEDSGLCALALARALKVFTGDAMLPTHPCVNIDELRVLGCSRVPRFLEGLPRPQNIGSVIVPDNSSRVILRPVFFTFCGVLSRKLNRECVFVFGSKKTKRRWRSLFLYRLLRTEPPDVEPGRESRPGLRIAAADSRLGC